MGKKTASLEDNLFSRHKIQCVRLELICLKEFYQEQLKEK